MNDPRNTEEDAGVSTRGPELGVALFLMALATLVIVDSLRVGVGWADDGPRSGYFPFYIGLALFGSSAWVAIGVLRRWKTLTAFASRAQIESVWSVLWPMVVYERAFKVPLPKGPLEALLGF